MNWNIEANATELADAKPDVSRAEDEGQVRPSTKLVDAAKAAATRVASELGKDVLVTINGHEGRGDADFLPGHVVITVSRIDSTPKTEGD